MIKNIFYIFLFLFKDMPRGVYEHNNRTKKADVAKFMEWWEQHKDEYTEVKMKHREAVKKYEEETGVKIKPQTAYKKINYGHC